MQELFKGYLPTNNKVPTIPFKDTNGLPLSNVESLPEYAGLLADNVICIDVDKEEHAERLMDIIEALQLNCRVTATKRGKHFYFYGDPIKKCGTHVKLAVGIEADIKIGFHNSYCCLKYEGKERKIIYDIEPDEEYESLPVWLTPLKGKNHPDFMTLDDGDGRNQTLFNYILTLQSACLSKEDIRETIKLINDYILPTKLDEAELNKILRDEAFNKPNFFNENGGFDHTKLGTYILNNMHVIRYNQQLHIYSDGVYSANKNKINAEIRKVFDAIKINQKREVLSYIEDKAPVVNKMADAKYIAFNNGIYNVETGKLEPFNPDIIVTNKIPHNYNYDAYNEDMDKVLDRLTCNDDAIRDLIEEMIGYCMYRKKSLRKAFVLIGDKANGKSTLLECITSMIGSDNTSSLDLKDLGDKFKKSRLFGKLLNAGDDIGDEFIADPATFKSLTSGGAIEAEFKGQDSFDFNNYATFIFSANNMPRIRDKTGAVLDRLIIIPFNATFTKDSPDYDPFIKDKLLVEESMEYLIQLALDGLKRVLSNNAFTIPDKVKNEIEEYHEKNDPLIGFFKEVDMDIDILNEPCKDVYLKYKIYCNDNNYSPLGRNQFTTRLKKDYGLDVKVQCINGHSVRVYIKEV